jgi:hypothetical protein
MRVSYRDDVGFLLRLEAATLKDVRQTVEWRNETARLARQLSMRYLQADATTNMGRKVGPSRSADR